MQIDAGRPETGLDAGISMCSGPSPPKAFLGKKYKIGWFFEYRPFLSCTYFARAKVVLAIAGCEMPLLGADVM